MLSKLHKFKINILKITVIKIWINQFLPKKKNDKCYYSCLILDDTAMTSSPYEMLNVVRIF